MRGRNDLCVAWSKTWLDAAGAGSLILVCVGEGKGGSLYVLVGMVQAKA